MNKDAFKEPEVLMNPPETKSTRQTRMNSCAFRRFSCNDTDLLLRSQRLLRMRQGRRIHIQPNPQTCWTPVGVTACKQTTRCVGFLA